MKWDCFIGIRIEDDLLITEDGCLNLSKEVPKQVEELECWMAKNVIFYNV